MSFTDRYEAEPPTKAWDALWGWGTYSGALRLAPRALALVLAISCTLVVLLVAAQAADYSADFAWAFLAATAVLAGVESLMRHRGASFGKEAAWVAVELVVLLVAAVAFGDSDVAAGIAAACGLELFGFGVGCAFAAMT